MASIKKLKTTRVLSSEQTWVSGKEGLRDRLMNILMEVLCAHRNNGLPSVKQCYPGVPFRKSPIL